MLSLAQSTLVAVDLNVPPLLVYGHREELLTQLTTYLAAVSITMWAIVLVTGIARIYTFRMYKSARHIQAATRKAQRGKSGRSWM